MSLRSQLAYLAAGLTLVLGLLGLINPVLVLRVTGLEVIEPRGLGEARALFGAMFVTMGGFMVWALSTRPRARTVLRFAGFLWLASALGRLLSLLLDAIFSWGGILLLAFDLLVGVGALLGSMEGDSGSNGGGAPPRRRGLRRGKAEPASEAEDPLKAYRS